MWLLLTRAALGADYDVDPVLGPYFTVTEALDAATQGTDPLRRIRIAAGTYEESYALAGDQLGLLEPQYLLVGLGATAADVVLRSTDSDGFLEVSGGARVGLQDLTLDGRTTDRLLTCRDASTCSALRVTARDGQTFADGAGFLVHTGAALSLVDCVLTGGDASGDGGQVAVRDAGTVFTAVGTRFEGGHAGGDGGAVACDPDTSCTVDDSVFVGNDAGGRGGGAYLRGLPTDWIRTDLCQNVAGDDGGALYWAHGGTLRASTLQGNRAADSGGAVRMAEVPGRLENVDLVENVGQRLGAVSHSEVTHTVLNALIAWNVSNDGSEVLGDAAGGALVVSSSLVFENSPVGVALAPPPNLVEVDPQVKSFVPGDCLATDLSPAPGSPLIDAGDPGIRDPDGTVADIGSHGGPACDDCAPADTGLPTDTGTGPPTDTGEPPGTDTGTGPPIDTGASVDPGGSGGGGAPRPAAPLAPGPDPGCGCAQGAGGGTGAFGLLALLARRRRQSQTWSWVRTWWSPWARSSPVGR